jgi:tungstate transport system substrate-binding protein
MSVRELGSLSAAAERMGMEYRQAWRVLDHAEKIFDASLTAKKVGGRGGGGSELTAEGAELLERLEHILGELGRSTSSAFHSPLGLSQPGETREVIVIASSTEPVDAGLLEQLEAAFKHDTGLTVRHIAAGSGHAHELAEWGRADAVLSHAPSLEARFMERGIGALRAPIMKSRFLLLGPHSDPAGLKELERKASLADMFRRIAERRAAFVSRNDSSGTNLKELELWDKANVPIHGHWYQTPDDAGGSAAAVRCAVRLSAYTLVDSSTASRHPELRRFTPAEEPGGENVYSVLVVNADVAPGANTEGALRLAEWLGSPRGREIIANYGRPAPLFEPIE